MATKNIYYKDKMNRTGRTVTIKIYLGGTLKTTDTMIEIGSGLYYYEYSSTTAGDYSAWMQDSSDTNVTDKFDFSIASVSTVSAGTTALYCSTKDVWDYLNRYKQDVVNEVVTTSGDGSTTFYSLSHGLLVDGTYSLSYGSDSTSANDLTESTHFSVNLERGWITLTTAGSAAISGSNLWATYKCADLPDATISDFIKSAVAEIEDQTSRVWSSQAHTRYLEVEYGENGLIQKDYNLPDFPISSITSISYQEAAPGSGETWTALTEGYDADWYADEEDLDYGEFHLTGENMPSVGKRQLKVVYASGDSTIPQTVKRLTIQKTIQLLMLDPIFAQTFIKGKSTFINLELAPLTADIDARIKELRKNAYKSV